MLQEGIGEAVTSSEYVSDVSLKNPDFVPKTIFEKNVSPGLQKWQLYKNIVRKLESVGFLQIDDYDISVLKYRLHAIKKGISPLRVIIPEWNIT